MSGLRKAKKYDWKDSNMALFGSDLDRGVKKASAQTEAAWNEAGREVGVQIWRIEKFKVKHWPRQDYGKFFNGDSYIILNTYKEPDGDELKYDVHFWIGTYSSQDEYGTAAYKTVELDTLLDDKPIQHREVEKNESSLFKSYFDTMTVMKGGCDSGFRHVKVKEYQPRLLHFCREGRTVQVNEVAFNKEKLNPGDVFIIDSGSAIIQWNGSESNKDEKFKAMQYCQSLESERGGKFKAEVVEEGGRGEEAAIQLLTDRAEEDDKDDQTFKAKNTTKELYRLTDRTGSLAMTLEAEGEISKSALDTNDVFILDGKTFLYVWIGRNTSPAEKKNAMTYAHNFLMKTDHPLVSVSCFNEGQETKAFDSAFA